MRLKLYRAAGVAEAMAQVRADLGADALILATRRVGGGVEVTAALEPEEDAAPPLRPFSPGEPARLAALRFHGVPDALLEGLLRGDLVDAMSRVVGFGRLDLAPDARPLLLVGPPGAGKTLSVARLATRLVMAGEAPMVITADGRRAGATEQLAAFTRLLGLNLIVASHPVTLGRALARRPDGAPVLIDAPAPYKPEELKYLADHCTEKEDDAEKVERQLRKSASALLLESRIGQRFDAIVTGASDKGTWVRILEPPVEGKMVTGANGLDVGDRVRVELVRTDVERGYIDFVKVGS